MALFVEIFKNIFLLNCRGKVIIFFENFWHTALSPKYRDLFITRENWRRIRVKAVFININKIGEEYVLKANLHLTKYVGLVTMV